MPLVAANGLQFHVQELGDGRPVVMLHGLLIGSLASWYFTVAPALAPAHRCRLYDLRDHRAEAVADEVERRVMIGGERGGVGGLVWEGVAARRMLAAVVGGEVVHPA